MKKILVADDDRTTRHLVQGILKKAGYTVTLCADGAESLEAMGKERFDLVLLDVWMPQMTGFHNDKGDLFKRIGKAFTETSSESVVAKESQAQAEEQVKGKAEIQKPADEVGIIVLKSVPDGAGARRWQFCRRSSRNAQAGSWKAYGSGRP